MTDTVERVERIIGQSMPRKEDARLITGQTRWTDNITLPGMLHAAILRSPVAHARITRVDVSAALERPGVVAAFSGADLADAWSTLPTAWTVSEDLKTPPHLPLATDKVRYVGDGVAVVVAENRYAAHDALEAIEVDYEPVACGRRHGGRARGRLTTRARRRPQQPHVHLPRRLRRLRGDKARGRCRCRHSALHQPAPDSYRDGAALSRRVCNTVNRRDNGMELDAGATLRAHLPGPEHRLARASHPGDCTRCRWRLRLETRHLRRRDHRSGAVAAARPPDQMDRNPKRGQPGHHPRPRPDPAR